MIWRIVKKDARLLWWMVVIVLLVRVAQGLVAGDDAQFSEINTYRFAFLIEEVAAYLAGAILIVLAVHQDGLVGSDQDWLTRPFDRRAVVAAKLLFAGIGVLLPLVALKLAIGVVHGFSAFDTLTGTLVAAVLGFVFLVLPAMMAGAATRTLAQSLAAAFVAVLIVLFTQPLSRYLGVSFAIDRNPFEWLATLLDALVIVAGAAVVLTLAYRRRAIRAAQIGCAVTFAVLLAVHLLPFRAVFALQQALSPSSAVADTIHIAYDPSLPPSRFVKTPTGGLAVPGKRRGPLPPFLTGTRMISKHLPVHVTGLPADAVVIVDYLALRLVAADGHTLYRTPEKENFKTWLLNQDEGQSFKLHHPGPRLGEHAIHQMFWLPPDVYAAIKDTPLHIEVDYALTMLSRHASADIPVLTARRAVAGVGICQSHVRMKGMGMVEVLCHAASDNAHCLLATAHDTATGKQNPLNDQCYPVYGPGFLATADNLAPATPMLYQTFSASSPEPGLPLGLTNTDKTRFPVDIADTPTARFAIASYRPAAHVWRHLKTPLVRLRDL